MVSYRRVTDSEAREIATTIHDPEKRAMMYAYVEQSEMTRAGHAAVSSAEGAKVIDAYVQEAADLQRQRAWLQSPAYWRLVAAVHIAGGLAANPAVTQFGLSTGSISASAREQADSLVAEMFGEVK